MSLGAVVGPILFVLAWLIMGFVRVGYSSIKQPISALAIDSGGIVMRTAFLLDGFLIFVGLLAFLYSMKE